MYTVYYDYVFIRKDDLFISIENIFWMFKSDSAITKFVLSGNNFFPPNTPEKTKN